MNQHAFEFTYLAHVLIHIGIGPFARETLLDSLLVPAAEEHPDIPAPGHGAPETPGLRAILFFVALVPERVHVHPAGIHPFVQGIHDLAFAGTFHPGNDHVNRDVALPHRHLRLEQLRAQVHDVGIVRLFAQRAADLCSGKHISPLFFWQCATDLVFGGEVEHTLDRFDCPVAYPGFHGDLILTVDQDLFEILQ